MDPNLIKIRDANKYLLKKGKIHRTITQAEDYLQYILGHNYHQINKELQSFVTHIKTMREQRG